MNKFVVSVLCALALAGCTGPNASLNTIQVSGAEETFPADYAARARRYLAGLEPAGQSRAGLQISYPRTVVGSTAFDARRWYVCLDGVVPSAPPSTRMRPVLDLWQPAPDRYHVILILRPGGSTTAVTGFDSPLCAGARYEPLAAG